MDAAKLAERDRARRERQVQKAKRQAFLIFCCLIAAVSGVLLLYYFGAPSESPEAEPQPAAVQPADQVRVPTPAPADETPKVDSKAPAAPESPKAAGLPGAKTQVPLVIPGREPVQPLPKVGEARMVIERFLKAATVMEKQEFVIPKPGIEDRMKAYYETRKGTDPQVKEQLADFVLEYGGSRFLDVAYRSATSPAGAVRAAFRRSDQGLVLLDWESFVGYGSVDWADFKKQRPTTPVILRAYASVDDYYNYEFADAKKFLSVRLRSPDGQHLVNGFCERGTGVATEIGTRLSTVFPLYEPSAAAGGRTWAPLIVRMRFPANAASDHCVELLEMVHGQWLAPEEIDR